MVANQQIIELLSCMIKTCQKGVLASVVSVQGSAYKREGAKMIIDENGQYYGMVSGGCLEAEIVELSKEVLNSGKPILKRYVLDEDVVWGLGLGCPGTVEIFLEPIDCSHIWQDIGELYENQTAMIVCKVVKDEGNFNGSLLVLTDTNVYGAWEDAFLQESVMAVAKRKLSQQRAVSETIIFKTNNGEKAHVFFDVHFPPAKLCIFGAGHDAIPVAQYGNHLGFDITVIDPRPAYNTSEHFPSATRLLLSPEHNGNLNFIDSRTYIVIMNHHFERDIETLAFSLQSDAPYVGLLGPIKRREKILAYLQEDGFTLTTEHLNKLFNPIGLDIGADSPEEIAVSIIAEITAFRNRHEGGFLKDKSIIHRKQQVLV
ncbi:XdhC family protein [Calidifontibacillus oryziterrae]|uniref:XdhC family protein n=1 Tax=Calidifontibacillus oryziterrae TaxID=1191699 RepID=UPI0002FD453F|nr:XdhC/CoxI family protein [Calidifontibacillus oryziterrae]